MDITRLTTVDADFSESLNRLLQREVSTGDTVFSVVMSILNAVREEGDAALLRYTERFDRLSLTHARQLWVPPAQRARALSGIAYDVRTALEQAADRIRAYHQHQVQADWSFQDEWGNTLMQRYTPMDRVGLYVPGGLASYPSSVLMNAIPAQVAGVSELIMVVPAPDGKLNDLVLAAAELAGVDHV
ncbi:MAG: histidinol dehydrogenase, partial [Gammaproteobacteria bacterium]